MFDFVPLKNYYDVYIYFSMFLVLAILLHAYTLELNSSKNIKFLAVSGMILLFSVIFYIGLRPISTQFGDMGAYKHYYLNYSRGASVTSSKDVTFHYYMRFLSNFLSVKSFFLVTEFLYIFPMYLISKIHFKKYWFYAFLMFVVSFSFYSYGTNGIRNGLASSMFLWGLCYPNKKIFLSFFFLLAVLLHNSLFLPILAYLITLFYYNPKTFMKGWLLAIPVSLFLGSVFIILFSSLGFGDGRLTGYLTGDIQQDTRFRWDFLFYSAFPVFSGWYFIIKRKFNDTFYYRVFSTYLICNGFWILVIRANFSNRFAYISWFLMAFVIIYPLLKQKFFKNQQIMIAKVVTAYFLFTYLMYFLYYTD